MASNETARFTWPLPAWNADWQKWQEIFTDLIRNIDATVFSTMSNMTLVMKLLPNVEITEPVPGTWTMTMDGDALFVSRTHLSEIRLAQETVQLEANSVLGLTFSPGAVGPQNIGWEVYSQGVDNAPEVIPVGYVDENYNIIWFNGAELAAGSGPQGLFEFPGGSGTTDRVKVSAADTLANYLGSKVVAGTNVVFTTLNPGANEQIQISVPAVTIPSPVGNVYVDINNGSDISGDGSIGNPYQTLKYAVAVELADVPTSLAEYEEQRTFHLAPGVYDHTAGPGFIKLPFRYRVAIVGNDVQIDGDIHYYQDPAMMFGSTEGAAFYMGSGDVPTFEFNGDFIAKNDNALPGTSINGPRAIAFEKMVHNGSIYNAASGNTNPGEGTGDLLMTFLQTQFTGSGTYFFGEGEDNTDPAADENRVIVLAYTSVILNDLTGNVVMRNLQNCWMYGNVEPETDPVTPGAYDGRAEGWGQKSFWNTVFNGTSYSFGNAPPRTGSPDDLYFDANSFASMSEAASWSFTDNDYVLEDEAIGVKMDMTGLAGNLKSGSSTVDLSLRKFDGFYGAGDSTIIVERGSDDVESANNLLNAWTSCKALTPGGNAIGKDNKAEFIVPAGNYDFGTQKWTIDGDYIEIKGEGYSSPKDNPSTRLYSDGVSADSLIDVTVATVSLDRLRVVTGPNRTGAGILLTTDMAVGAMRNMEFEVSSGVAVYCSASDVRGYFENIKAANQAFLPGGDVRAIFRFCQFGDNSYGGHDVASSRDSLFRGIAFQCIGGAFCFGASQDQNATFSGRAEMCRVQDDSFGSSSGTAKIGTVTDAAVLVHCEAGSRSFGYSDDEDGFFEGKAIRCDGSDYCFGSTGVGGTKGGIVAATGDLRGCRAGSYSFGGSDGLDPAHDEFLGQALDSNGGSNCFGTKNHFDGVLARCTATGMSFGGLNSVAPQTQAALYDCVGTGLGSTIRAYYMRVYRSDLTVSEGPTTGVIQIVDDSTVSKIFHSILVAPSTSTYAVTSSGGIEDIKVGLCLLNKDIDPNLNNLIGMGNNVVDSDVG